MNAKYLDDLPIHFILCTERTGSSLLSLMLNLHSNILSPSEEPFAIYFWKKYRNKTSWNEPDIIDYVDSFFLISEKNTNLYFSKKSVFLESLLEHKKILNFERVVKLTYLHFIDIKDKSNVSCIVDKQIKYFFHLELIQRIFPSAKYIILTRDVRDNIVSKSNRKLNWNQHPLFLSALWNDTYNNIEKLDSNKRIIVTYESLISNSELVLKNICHWLEIEYQPKMIETEGVFESLLVEKKNDLSSDFLNRLKHFHSGLSQKPNSNKIGQYKEALDPKIVVEIESICGDNLNNLGYETNSNSFQISQFKRIYFTFLAKCYRRYLLTFYLHIPLWLKLKIKLLRKKKSVV
ncbi:MAG: sulfotransferase family protein [Crocinitomicaceae bacterium]